MSHLKVPFSQSVLFIDDQTKFESLIRGGLLSYPAEYEFCPSRLNTALERFRGETPDLIVSTLEYLEGNVLDLIRGSHGLLERVPAMFISEPYMADLEAQLALEGRFQVVERTMDSQVLIQRMAEAIAEKKVGSPSKPSATASGGVASGQKDWAEAIIKKIK
ncbi:hypothetical protein EB061_05750 [bacterium]|jgi:DNA-binding NtrC family response regulator|nr:hypothetical protein [bacterium]